MSDPAGTASLVHKRPAGPTEASRSSGIVSTVDGPLARPTSPGWQSASTANRIARTAPGAAGWARPSSGDHERDRDGSDRQAHGRVSPQAGGYRRIVAPP